MTVNRDKAWIEDLELLSKELPKRHKNLFFYKSEKQFYDDIEEIKRNLKDYDDYEIMVQIAKVIGSFRDAHTSIVLPARSFLPFELYWFSDGIYIIEATADYNTLLYNKITKINDIDISEVIEKLSLIISYENHSFLKSQLPKFLVAVELLYGLEIIDEIEFVKLTLEDREGIKKNHKIKTCQIKEMKELLKEEEDRIKRASKALYRRHRDKYFWYQYLEEFKLIYFKYNACKEMKEETVKEASENLLRFIKKNEVEKLVIDMRNNFGGDSTLLDDFIEKLALSRINKEGSIFVVVGRETFSSALLNVFSLKEKTKAIFIGEDTGGKPNCYGEVERFKMKNSGLTICYSTKYYKIIKDDSILSFSPDVVLDISIENYIRNFDPCLDYILKIK